MCMFSLDDFLYLFDFFAGGGRVCGLFLNGIFFFFFFGGGGGGGHVRSTLRLRLRLSIISWVGYTQI